MPAMLYTALFEALACFAAATLLHSLGLIGDPATWVHETFPFLKFR